MAKGGGKGGRAARKDEIDLRGELAAVMFGFGDTREQLPESLDLMNSIVTEYIEGMTQEAMAATFNGQLTQESLQFAIRKDQRKADRVQQLLDMFHKVVEERNLHLVDEGKDMKANSASQEAVPKKRKVKSSDAAAAKAKRAKAAAAKAAKVAAPIAPKSKVSANVDQMLAAGDLANLTASPANKS